MVSFTRGTVRMPQSYHKKPPAQSTGGASSQDFVEVDDTFIAILDTQRGGEHELHGVDAAVLVLVARQDFHVGDRRLREEPAAFDLGDLGRGRRRLVEGFHQLVERVTDVGSRDEPRLSRARNGHENEEQGDQVVHRVSP
jgi:hypothetical protein